MIRYIISLGLIVCIASSSSAQGTYYNGINDSLRCEQLKTALKQLINTGTLSRTYEESVGLFMQLYDIKDNPLGTGKVMWDMYSDNPDGTIPYIHRTNEFCNNNQNPSTEDVCWNREHALPSSWFGGEASSYYADIINLIPTDAYVNNRRGNNPIGEVSTATFTSLNGSKLGNSATSGVSGVVFEPIDAYKGDLARIMLYMITRYEDSIPSWTNADAQRVLGTDKLKGFKDNYLNLMLEWHEQDPPSAKEIDRNNRIGVYQRNRNPFVDRPEYATRIWKTSSQDCINFSVGVKNFQQLDFALYPNPANGNSLFINGISIAKQEYYITDVAGRTLERSVLTQNSLDISQLGKGMYFLFISNQGNWQYGQFSVVR